mgnify:CR=1 FL=1
MADNLNRNIDIVSLISKVSNGENMGDSFKKDRHINYKKSSCSN